MVLGLEFEGSKLQCRPHEGRLRTVERTYHAEDADFRLAPEVAKRSACRDQECFRATLTLWPRKPQFVPRAATKFEKF